MASAIGGKGVEGGKYKDLDREHPDLDKFKRMQKAGLPQGAIENAMLRDGILPSSLFDNAQVLPDGNNVAPLKLVITPKPKPAAPVPETTETDESKPPPGLSLMDEMKWRQAQKKKNGASGGDFLKLSERKKSVTKTERMVALKPTNSPDVIPSTQQPKPLFGGQALKPVATTNTPAAAKFSAPAYSNILRPAAQNSLAQQVAKKAEEKKANEPAPAPKFEIEVSQSEPIQLPPAAAAKVPEKVVLEDGNIEIVRDKDGGFVQTNKETGVVIRQFADGATRQTNPDGTVIDCAKGVTVQVNPDGTRFECNEKGEITTCFADGTIVIDFGNGEKRQDNPDGVSIVTKADGTKIQSDVNSSVTITVHPDGSIDQVDKATGKSIHVSPQGVVEQRS